MTIDPDTCAICGSIDCEHTDDQRADHNRRMSSGQEPLDDTADVKAVAAKARTAKQKEKQAAGDFSWLMNDPRGRRYVWALLARCGVYQSSFARAQGNFAGMSFFEGERNIGLELMARCLAEQSDKYQLMIKENGG